jgi:hypothetical protein
MRRLSRRKLTTVIGLVSLVLALLVSLGRPWPLFPFVFWMTFCLALGLLGDREHRSVYWVRTGVGVFCIAAGSLAISRFEPGRALFSMGIIGTFLASGALLMVEPLFARLRPVVFTDE